MKYVPRYPSLDATPTMFHGHEVMVFVVDGEARVVPTEAFLMLYERPVFASNIDPDVVKALADDFIRREKEGRSPLFARQPVDTEAIKRGPRKERNHAAELAASPVRRIERETK